MITVANIRTTKAGENGVYVGRAVPRKGVRGSPLGNPFKLQPGQERPPVIEQYAAYLRYILAQSEGGLTLAGRAVRAEFDRLVELARAGDLVLLCWCAPELCHADIIKAEIERRLGE